MACHVLRCEKVQRQGGGGRDIDKAEDKREVVLADGKPVLRDLASVDEQSKGAQGQVGFLREEKLNSIGFVWDEKEYNWKVMV